MKKRILIIGGMGPQASLLLHKRIIQCAIDFGAKDNVDFPMITHVSIPMPDFISANSKARGEAASLLRDCLYCLWPSKLYAYCTSL